MAIKYYIHSGKESEGKNNTHSVPSSSKTSFKKNGSGSAAGLIITIFTLAVLIYSYIFASGSLDEYIDRSTYEHLEGMYIGGLGEASYVFAQKMEDSVLAGILGLEYVNTQRWGEAVYTSGSGK